MDIWMIRILKILEAWVEIKIVKRLNILIKVIKKWLIVQTNLKNKIN